GGFCFYCVLTIFCRFLAVLPLRHKDTNFCFWDVFFSFIPDLLLENLCPSPDSSGNPFAFFSKAKDCSG
ncbi:hypothetical protein, partial [Flavobacterium sp. ANB]|uniref:hypothetical protein n=1 Tax=Flavobacterium sp. ANB TaxID=2783790 RepID=UPI001E4078C2